MSEGEMLVLWSYWPEAIQGTVNDPITGSSVAVSFRHAMVLAGELKLKYGSNLRYVDIKLRILQGSAY